MWIGEEEKCDKMINEWVSKNRCPMRSDCDKQNKMLSKIIKILRMNLAWVLLAKGEVNSFINR
jgi:hypothetical protein